MRRIRGWVLAVGSGFAVVSALASIALAAAAVVVLALVVVIRRMPWPSAVRWVAVAVAANAVLVPAGVLLQGPAHRVALKVPTPAGLVPMTAGSQVDPAIAWAADPADWRSWLAAASAGDTSAGGTAGTLDLERAFLLDPGAQPALALSFSYLQRATGGGDANGMLANDEIAAYLTVLGGGPAPPDPRHPAP